jgi:transposase-like protein
MSFRYASDFRHQVCERMLAGEAIKELAAELSISDATLYKWRRQALIDAGRRAGTKNFDVDPLEQARRRIKDLEAELKVVKAASALFSEEEETSPKGSTRLFGG